VFFVLHYFDAGVLGTRDASNEQHKGTRNAANKPFFFSSGLAISKIVHRSVISAQQFCLSFPKITLPLVSCV
jgi:hypothetical protein